MAHIYQKNVQNIVWKNDYPASYIKPLRMKLLTGTCLVLLSITVSLIISFKRISAESVVRAPAHRPPYRVAQPTKIGEIPLPTGYTRSFVRQGSFGEWLRTINLRKNNTVYLYNGEPVERQDLHYAVLDISTGNKDLQQCADAVMRLKAEYHFARKEYDKIVFGEGTHKLSFSSVMIRGEVTEAQLHEQLLHFMEKVFINCGTYTVDAMTKQVDIRTIQVGDIFVKAGAPGHAMIVTDVAENAAGEKIFLLAQSFMPAQDIHIVINPMNTTLSPWYAVMNYKTIITPGWAFDKGQLKRWK